MACVIYKIQSHQLSPGVLSAPREDRPQLSYSEDCDCERPESKLLGEHDISMCVALNTVTVV